MCAIKYTSPALNILTPPGWKDYELLDSGDGQKLERYSRIVLIRPEPEAVWKPALGESEWKAAHAVFRPAPEENGGHWEARRSLPERWEMGYEGLRFWVQTSTSRHLGIFPEQASQWVWLEDKIRRAGRPLSVLNLFGYTGAASLAAARAGARVTHLDASRKAVTWANENLALSGLEAGSVRWMVDDALKFVQREGRRGTHYDGVVLDPPKFGRGPKGEVWEFYRMIPELLAACREILKPQPVFAWITAYAVKASSITLHYAMQEMTRGWKGEVQAGELALVEASAGRLVSTAVFASWCASGEA